MMCIFSYLMVYFYFQFQNMNKGHNDAFSSVLINLNQNKDDRANLSKDGNFLQFYELKFEDINVIKSLGIIKSKEIDSSAYGFDVHHEIDFDILNKFITFDIKFRKRSSKFGTRFMMGRHRKCTKEDFISRKYYKSLPSDYKNYICYEYDKIKDYYNLKDGYLTSENNEMESIYMEINKCLSDCESDENIQKMLSLTWVNVYNLIEQISFKSRYNQKDNDDLTIITPQLTN